MFPNFPSALVCAARERARESLKAIAKRFGFNTILPKAKKYPAIRYNLTCCTLRKDKLSLATTNGRLKIDLIKNPILKTNIKNLLKTCEVLYKASDKTWFVIVFENIKEPERIPQKNILGIDRGIKNIVVCSNNLFINSDKLRNIKNKYKRLRGKLQSKGTRSAKRLSGKIRDRENRFVKDCNHCVSKQLVKLPFDTFVLEKLDIKKQKKLGKKFNSLLNGWSWRQLEVFLTYKALLVGKRVEYVDAKYTSQKCSVCGHIDRRNRPSTSSFKCTNCFFTLSADLNAARNIRVNYIASIGITDKTLVAVNQPNASTEMASLRLSVGGS
jgi:IS605 OrfB family transposase